MMAIRLIEMRRLLEGTSIHLHPTAGHWLRTLMDAVFGAARFRNQIVRKRASSHSGSGRFTTPSSTTRRQSVSHGTPCTSLTTRITSSGSTATGTRLADAPCLFRLRGRRRPALPPGYAPGAEAGPAGSATPYVKRRRCQRRNPRRSIDLHAFLPSCKLSQLGIPLSRPRHWLSGGRGPDAPAAPSG